MKIILNCAQSIDGKLGYIGKQTELSNSEDWKQVHLMRERADIILVGANTVRVDNPSLLVKKKHLGREPKKQPARAVISASGEIPLHLKIFQTPPKTIIFTTEIGKKRLFNKIKEQNNKNIDYIQIISVGKQDITPERIVNMLEQEGYESLMIEGGAMVFSMFLTSSLSLKFRVFTAPVLLGEENTVPLIRKGSTNLKLKTFYNLGKGIVSCYEK